MAKYLLHGLSSSSNDIQSTEGWANQPVLQWPGMLFFYPLVNTADKPKIVTQGLEFKNDQYLEFSTHFDNKGSDYITVNVWVYRPFGQVIGNIITISNNVSVVLKGVSI